MSWNEIYNQVKRELRREPKSEEVQKRMMEAAMDVNSVFHRKTETVVQIANEEELPFVIHNIENLL